MTIHRAIETAHTLFLSGVTSDTRRPSPADIRTARQKLNGETLAQWSVPWQKSITSARKMIADHA